MCSRLLICSAVLIWLLAGCRTRPEVEPRAEAIHRSQPLLGTFVTITTYSDNPPRAHDAISAAFDEIHRVDRLLSNHRPDSEASKMNTGHAGQPVQISPELHSVLAQALEIGRRTEGAFDPTIGPLAQLWGFIWKEYRLPTNEELDRVLPLIGYKQVRLYTNNASATDYFVQFARPEMFIDFGGIGKGYAVDRAVHILQEHRITNAMVRAGGDLRVIGTPPGESVWDVQLEDPRKQGRRTTVRLRDGALSTSGNYENYFEIDDRRYSHILDPRTGLPVQGIGSCTVIAPTCVQSDSYATAFFVLGIQKSIAQFGNEFGIRFLDTDLNETHSATFPK